MLRFTRLRSAARRLSAAATPRHVPFAHAVGEEVPGTGFTVRARSPVADFGLECITLSHTATGARWLHLAAPGDTSNTFAVGFVTLPDNDNGTFHILEHVSLCGSRRFPVRDPFFAMLNGRSAASFMNAFTAQDWTLYPFTTADAADFANLRGVYLDAALFATLERADFDQEGHRLALLAEAPEDTSGTSSSDATTSNDATTTTSSSKATTTSSNETTTSSDASGPTHGEKEKENSEPGLAPKLRRHGVVFNEMKGAMADGNALLMQALGAAVFPATAYSNNSGGDPRAIPTLTHEELVAAHKRFYHPRNAYLFTYGDLPLTSSLAEADAALRRRLDDCGGLDAGFDGTIERQPRFTTPPPPVTFPCPPDASGNSDAANRICLSWMAKFDSSNVRRGMAMQVCCFLVWFFWF
jgi:Zn-dependent M16 (insulinase) family peptidase